MDICVEKGFRFLYWRIEIPCVYVGECICDYDQTNRKSYSKTNFFSPKLYVWSHTYIHKSIHNQHYMHICTHGTWRVHISNLPKAWKLSIERFFFISFSFLEMDWLQATRYNYRSTYIINLTKKNVVNENREKKLYAVLIYSMEKIFPSFPCMSLRINNDFFYFRFRKQIAYIFMHSEEFNIKIHSDTYTGYVLNVCEKNSFGFFLQWKKNVKNTKHNILKICVI